MPKGKARHSARVALRKESVDRNKRSALVAMVFGKSLSARRAWIEIAHGYDLALMALSLSARRAWIEMPM